MKRMLVSLLACSSLAAWGATGPDVQKLEECFRQRGAVSDEARLRCYDNVFMETPAVVEKTMVTSPAPMVSTTPGTVSHLRNLWRPDPEVPDGDTVFRQYKQNYILPWTITATPNKLPRSENADNTVRAATPPEAAELKFQFSAKSRLPFTRPASRHAWWLAYTQQSHWQLYDAEHSRPFRESDYEPELIYSYDMSGRDTAGWPLAPQFVNIGLVHQSNGQSLPRSRSWNRLYAQLGMEEPVGPGNLAVLIRPWIRIPEGGSDDNPDIGRYIGYGELEVKYWLGKRVYSMVARRRSIQFDIPIPYLPGFTLQYFNGYGESLIDYNQHHQTLGIGYSLPYGR